MAGEAERLLVQHARAGDAEAFAALIAARRSALLVLAAATVGDWDEAEDVLQDALFRAYTRLHRLRETDRFDGWLRRVVLNVARDHLRAALGRVRRDGDPGGAPEDLERLLQAVGDTNAAPVAPEADLVDREACAAIMDAIAALPSLQRRAGRLAWVAGMPLRDVVRLLGISRDSLHGALHRGRTHLGAVFYAKGDWRKDVEAVPDEAVVVAGWRDVQEAVAHLTRVHPDLRAVAVDNHHAGAHVAVRTLWGQAPALDPDPPPPEQAIPLDALADAAGFDLEPFGNRLLRYTHGGRLYWLPRDREAHVVLYKADLLARVGLPLPPADWTWDEFFGYCRRCHAAGLHPLTKYSPGPFETAWVAEQLGATQDHLKPFREAVDFVREWRRHPWNAPEREDGWALGSFLEGSCAFCCFQVGHPAVFFRDPRFRPLRWGIAPMPRFRRSDPHVQYNMDHVIEVRGTGPDPVGAYRVAQAIITDGPVPELDHLPAYRTREIMRAWLAQPLPLGKECLLEVEAATDPLYQPQYFVVLPGGGRGDAIERMLGEEITLEEGLRALQLGVAAYRGGQPLAIRD